MSAEQLMLLASEIRAITRAGLPLSTGLMASAEETPGRMGRMLSALAEQLAGGQSLSDAIASGHIQLPKTQAAVIQAGEAANNLAKALDSLLRSGAMLRELRQMTITALIYPVCIVLMIALLCVLLIPILLEQMAMMWGSHIPHYLKYAVVHAHAISMIAGIVGVLLTLAGTVWYWRSRRAPALLRGRSLWFLPGMRELQRRIAMANLAEHLALLVENQLPLSRAFPLAAAASGDARWLSAANEFAASWETGAQPHAGELIARGFPRSIAWPIAAGQNAETLASQLHEVARWQQQQAVRQADWIRIFAPPIFSVAIGGVAVALFAFGVLAPYVHLENHLAKFPSEMMQP
jgi:type II secretory pathway component PulF